MVSKKMWIRTGAVIAGGSAGWLYHWLRSCSGAT